MGPIHLNDVLARWARRSDPRRTAPVSSHRLLPPRYWLLLRASPIVTNSRRLPPGEWFYDESLRLGRPGGFGEVFEGKGSSGIVATPNPPSDAQMFQCRIRREPTSRTTNTQSSLNLAVTVTKKSQASTERA